MNAAGLPSIGTRLTRVLLLGALAWSAAAAVLSWLVVHHEVDQTLDGALQESAEIVHGVLSYLDAQGRLADGGALPMRAHRERIVWQLATAEGRVLLRSHAAPAQSLAGTPHAAIGLVGGDWHVFAMPFGAQGATLVVAQSEADRREARGRAVLATVGVTLAFGLLVGALLLRRVGRELQPLRALSRQVADYHPLEPGSRLAPAERAELAPLHDAVAELGERLARRVAAERMVAAHAAHALRTPLAGLSAQLAVAQREGDPAIQPRLRQARQAAERLRRVVSALLALFRAGAGPQRQAVDLRALAASLPVDGLALSLSPGPCVADIDPDLVAAALLNLLDNAVRHGAQRARLDCRAEAGGGAVLEMRDDGPGVAPERRRLLQQWLAEGDEPDDDAADGQRLGLGLLLADQVARAHGGGLDLLDAAGGGAAWPGFALALRLPGAAAGSGGAQP